jgi:NADPH-dependent F420 reductase
VRSLDPGGAHDVIVAGSPNVTQTLDTTRDPRELPDVSQLVVGVLGGTGDQGRGLARRLALAGHHVIIGSRDAARAAVSAADLGLGTSGMANVECARMADIVIIAVPWEGHAALLEALRDALVGKVVVDCVNPMGFDKQGAYALRVPEGSAAEQAAGILTESRVVAAFHHISAVLLMDEGVESIDTDVLVLGDDREATDIVQALAGRITGIRGVFGGRLRNAGQVEGLTANLISMNRRYKVHAGIRVTDI